MVEDTSAWYGPSAAAGTGGAEGDAGDEGGEVQSRKCTSAVAMRASSSSYSVMLSILASCAARFLRAQQSPRAIPEAIAASLSALHPPPSPPYCAVAAAAPLADARAAANTSSASRPAAVSGSTDPCSCLPLSWPPLPLLPSTIRAAAPEPEHPCSPRAASCSTRRNSPCRRSWCALAASRRTSRSVSCKASITSPADCPLDNVVPSSVSRPSNVRGGSGVEAV
mmetsp:Transcript_14173/g.34330  ORF Transcript_14173/g.34330 Transcript_14173/m.34330 type:complete len:224 (+) Transcript_14173:2221-2892(+)